MRRYMVDEGAKPLITSSLNKRLQGTNWISDPRQSCTAIIPVKVELVSVSSLLLTAIDWQLWSPNHGGVAPQSSFRWIFSVLALPTASVLVYPRYSQKQKCGRGQRKGGGKGKSVNFLSWQILLKLKCFSKMYQFLEPLLPERFLSSRAEFMVKNLPSAGLLNITACIPKVLFSGYRGKKNILYC